jgi:hypothetical protein
VTTVIVVSPKKFSAGVKVIVPLALTTAEPWAGSTDAVVEIIVPSTSAALYVISTEPSSATLAID